MLRHQDGDIDFFTNKLLELSERNINDTAIQDIVTYILNTLETMQFHEARTDNSTGKEPMQSSAYSCYLEGIVGRYSLEPYKTY